MSKRCSRCGGSGELICAHCGGQGYVRESDGQMSPCVRCDGLGTKECPTCNGMGESAFSFKEIMSPAYGASSSTARRSSRVMSSG